MSLTSSLRTASTALAAAQTGLSVVGNNIANVNTPDYIRQEVQFTPATAQQKGNLSIGLGVKTEAIVQKIDKYLEERLRGARSDVAGSEAEETTLRELESIIGELGDTDISTQLTTFFSRIQDLLDQPESTSARNLVVLQGQTLTESISSLYERVSTVRTDLDSQIDGAVKDINVLTGKVANLNTQITAIEGGSGQSSDAVGLRDERGRALRQLSELIDIRTAEQENGSVTVFVGGDYLVSDGRSRTISSVKQENNVATDRIQIRINDTKAPVALTGGRLAGLASSRDDHLDGFLDGLDNLAQTVIHEFNKIHGGGQGLVGRTSATATFGVSSAQQPLDAVGLVYPPENGSVTVLVRDSVTGETTSRDVTVRLLGLKGDSTLNDIAAQFNQIDGIKAEIDPTGKLSLKSSAPTVEFSFSNDTAGLAAALGIGSFFTGTGAVNIGVSGEIAKDPRLLATSSRGVGNDTDVAAKLAQLLDQPLASQGGKSLAETYETLVANTVQNSHNVSSAADAFRTFRNTLEGQKLSQSGVSLDEEAVNMISFQYAYQANAKVISTVRELMETLLQL